MKRWMLVKSKLGHVKAMLDWLIFSPNHIQGIAKYHDQWKIH